MLTRSGWDVVSASDGQEAWDILVKEHIRMVITDWLMPNINGLELIERIRSASFPNYTYLILLTSRDTRNSILEGLQAGADDYLTKPFDRDELMARLAIGERILRLEERLEEMATHDSLTGLLNRRALYSRILSELNRSMREKSSVSLIILDIDHFKLVNDSYGHLTGDRALCLLAETLTQNKRAYDVVGRWGGEEFLALLPKTFLTDAQSVAERFRTSVADAELQLLDGRTVQLSVSIGVTSSICGTENIETLIRQADEAMYQAKKTGRNKVCLYQNSQNPLNHGSFEKVFVDC